MLPITSVVLILAATSQISSQPHNSNGLNVISDLQSPVEQALLKTPTMDIAQNYAGNCDRIRAASNGLGLGLSSDEIDQLGSGHSIFMDSSRLAQIHSILQQYGDYQSTAMQGQEGQFWFFESQYSSLPYDSSLVAQKSTKSITDVALIRKIFGNEMVDFLAQSSSGSIGFAYNFGGKTCWVIVSLGSGRVCYGPC